MDMQIILPRAPTAQEIRFNWRYEVWKREKEAVEPKFAIENIHFTHDPYWRERYFGISTINDVRAGKCAAIGPTILWTTVQYSFVAAATGPYLLQLFF